MNASGVIGGTPQVISGTRFYTITGTNSGGVTATQITITVLEGIMRVGIPVGISAADLVTFNAYFAAPKYSTVPFNTVEDLRSDLVDVVSA